MFVPFLLQNNITLFDAVKKCSDMVYVVSRVVDSREVFSSDFFAVNAGTSDRVVPEFNTLSGDF